MNLDRPGYPDGTSGSHPHDVMEGKMDFESVDFPEESPNTNGGVQIRAPQIVGRGPRFPSFSGSSGKNNFTEPFFAFGSKSEPILIPNDDFSDFPGHTNYSGSSRPGFLSTTRGRCIVGIVVVVLLAVIAVAVVVPLLLLGKDDSPCSSDPCMNGATCKSSDDISYSCACTAGFVGATCEADINECEDYHIRENNTETGCVRWNAVLLTADASMVAPGFDTGARCGVAVAGKNNFLSGYNYQWIITWNYPNGSVIPAGNSRITVDKINTLDQVDLTILFADAETADTGLYTCSIRRSGTNEIQSTTFNFTVDVDECQQPSPCLPTFSCVNNVGSFECICDPYHLLSNDNQSCVAWKADMLTKRYMVSAFGEDLGSRCGIVTDDPDLVKQQDWAIKWHYPNGTINKETLDMELSSTMLMRDVDLSDSGQYRCDVTVNGLTSSTVFNLTLDASLCPIGTERCPDDLSICFHRCDDIFECPNRSDELGCSPECKPDEYRCPEDTNRAVCLRPEYLCDSHPECSQASDESQCPCDEKTHRRCRGGTCIPKVWWCDGDADCLDYSDEINSDCGTVTPSYSYYYDLDL